MHPSGSVFVRPEMLRVACAPFGCFLVARLFPRTHRARKSGTDHVFHAGSEISTRFRSGSRTYTERSFDTAPVLATGPSMMRMPFLSSVFTTSARGMEEMKQRSSDPGTATCARGENSLPHSCRLIFWLPNL